MEFEKNSTYIGIVIDNLDPERMGRCKIRIDGIFDGLSEEQIPWARPWKDLNGNSFIIPGKDKVVTVVFDSGDVYNPEYIFAENYNFNLQKKLRSLNLETYVSMRAPIFDDKTQIFSNDEEGLTIDYKLSKINIDSDSNINLVIPNADTLINFGSQQADQSVILGNNFLDWFRKFLSELVTNGYIGNLGVPAVANTTLTQAVSDFNANFSNFLSTNVFVTKNEIEFGVERPAEDFQADNYQGTVVKLDLVLPEDVRREEEQQLYTDVILNLPGSGGGGGQVTGNFGNAGDYPALKESDFISTLNQVAARLQQNATNMLRIMKRESGLRPSIQNVDTNATGLIQIMPATAIRLGTTVDKLKVMTATEQLVYVEKYYSDWIKAGVLKPNASVGDLYLVTFYPAAANKPDDYEIGSSTSPPGSGSRKRYTQNEGLDFNKDGVLTAGDVRRAIEATTPP